MPEINPQLLNLFAQTNALLEPIRDWQINQQVAGIWERREVFRQRGLPCPPAGGDGAARVSAHEKANRLERSGAVVYSRTKGKRSHWRLSQGEYLRLAFWTLRDGLPETHLAMRAIEANWKRGAVTCPDKSSRWASVSEAILTGCDEIDDPTMRSDLVVRLEEMLAPAMAFDWVRSHSDVAGRVKYQLTPQGWKTLKSFPTFEPPEYDSDFACQTADEYEVELRREREAIGAIRGQSNHVVVPARSIELPDVEPAPPILDATANPILDWSDE